jgi:putative hydrolase of HD superfamily
MDDSMITERLEKQIAFLLEIDKIKQVFRQTYLLDESRRENDAEHSWHFAMFVFVLAEYAPAGIDLTRVIKMALVHDLVEIDVGDIIIYDVIGERAIEKENKERAAAERIFGMLPSEQGAEFQALWEEFEARETPEARYARALDRLQPFLHNCHTRGRAWREHGITADRVLAVNQSVVADGAPALEGLVTRLVAEAVAKGDLKGSSQ